MTITIEQIRAARALLGWNQTELANASRTTQSGIARAETQGDTACGTLLRAKAALEYAGIEFIPNGVQKRDTVKHELLEALELADAALSGANMDIKHIEKKIKSTIAKAKGGAL